MDGVHYESRTDFGFCMTNSTSKPPYERTLTRDRGWSMDNGQVRQRKGQSKIHTDASHARPVHVCDHRPSARPERSRGRTPRHSSSETRLCGSDRSASGPLSAHIQAPHPTRYRNALSLSLSLLPRCPRQHTQPLCHRSHSSWPHAPGSGRTTRPRPQVFGPGPTGRSHDCHKHTHGPQSRGCGTQWLWPSGDLAAAAAGSRTVTSRRPFRSAGSVRPTMRHTPHHAAHAPGIDA